MPTSLRSLSDSAILARVRELTSRERSVTIQILLHLNEVERRRLHLAQGYASMFAYCTAGLGYSESSANLRIRTARCLARFPEVHDLLKAGKVNPSTIARVSRILTPANKDRVLARIRNKSQREVESIVAEYDTRSAVPRDRVHTVVMRVPMPESGVCVATNSRHADFQPLFSGQSAGCMNPTPAMHANVATTLAAHPNMDSAPATAPRNTTGAGWQENHRRNSGDSAESAAVAAAEVDAGPARCGAPPEARTVFKFAASEAFEKKFHQIRLLASHRLPVNPSFEQIFALAMDCFLEKHDPSVRQERRERRRQRKALRPTPAETVATDEPARKERAETAPRSRERHAHKVTADRRRYIPAHIRDHVVTRDNGRCTFVGPDGHRCGSAYVLQVDHITPVARGGASTPDNLRLLCAYHNRLEAERIMGSPRARPCARGDSCEGAVDGDCPGGQRRARQALRGEFHSAT
ncbi:MAG TPA: HNH endonuclease [Candidatus Krumholzibacteria bacterium]|nr:HNH endonuclease [Candidatus Krumholzibacteria bacterium]